EPGGEINDNNPTSVPIHTGPFFSATAKLIFPLIGCNLPFEYRAITPFVPLPNFNQIVPPSSSLAESSSLPPSMEKCSTAAFRGNNHTPLLSVPTQRFVRLSSNNWTMRLRARSLSSKAVKRNPSKRARP